MKRLLLLLLLAAPSYAALTIVQAKGGTNSTRCDNNGSATTTVNCSFGSTPTVGTLIVATCNYYNFNSTVTATLTDNQTNSYTRRAAIENTAHYEASIHDAVAATSSGTFTLTCTLSEASYMIVHIYEVSGNSASPFDQTGTNSSDASSASGTVSTAGATTTNDEIVFGSFGSSTNNTATAGTDYTLGETSTTATSCAAVTIVCSSDVYRIVTATGTQTPTIDWSPAAGSGYGAVVATYAQAAAGATYVANPTVIMVGP